MKSVWEHASFGLDDSSVVQVSREEELQGALEARHERLGKSCFAERFIPGREFNVGLLEKEGRVEILPIAEVQFVDWPADRPRIVGYAAKWEPSSFEYHATPRTFDLPSDDESLVRKLEWLAYSCWRAFSLRGVCAVVDFGSTQTVRQPS
ncbi:MAG: hypothetical protein HC882_06925 [Acidobacteria bacterium]|nr:hypothetical protein [Acidobacteriota bacterium]